MSANTASASLRHRHLEAIVIGGSAGVLDVLRTVLGGLPVSLSIPVLVVVHLPPRSQMQIHESMRAATVLPVQLADDKEPLQGGHIYFAPAGYHLLVESNRCIALSVDEPVHFSRPSIDVLFDSACDVYGPALLGILLTGASADGAAGAQCIHDAGGLVIVQEPSTAEASVMPQSALELFEPNFVAEPAAIAALLATLSQSSI